MTYKNKTDLIKSNELFWGLDDDLICKLFPDDEIAERMFKSGDIILDNTNNNIGIVATGTCNVIDSISGAHINYIAKGELFGFDSIYLQIDNPYQSDIIAKGNTSVINLNREVIVKLIEQNPQFSISFIQYLSKRVDFLNKKVLSFGGKSTESRLALFLLEKFNDYKTYKLECSVSSLADTLNIGRASIYRAFNRLIRYGCIEKDGKIIRLLDREKLNKMI